MERAGLLAHSHTRRFLALEERTLAAVEDMLSRHAPVVSWSGGKDSTVCLHLCNRVRPTPGVFLDSGGEHPLTPSFVAAAAEELGVPFSAEHPRLSYPELLELAYEFGEHCAYLPPGAVREFIIVETSAQGCRRWSADAYVLGLRGQESRGRRLTAAIHGAEYAHSSGLTRLLPLTRWSAEDVLAYTVKHGLPLHPAYTDERLPGERLVDIRVGVVTDPTAHFGGSAWARLRSFHPEVFNALRVRLPSINWPI